MSPDLADRTAIAAVEAAGWTLKVYRVETRHGTRYDAELTDPDGQKPYALLLWNGLPAVYESVGTFLAPMNLGHVASLLRAKVEAEVRP